MKKIGFVDYYLSEWHANDYPSRIARIAEETGLDYKLSYAWAEEDISPVDGVTTDQWCEKYGVERCATLAELCEKSDVIVVLSPDNPEKHLGYAEEVLKYGKRTYIDKTFAPDLKTAKQIFALGEKYGTPFFSTSALRYATELDQYENCRQIITGGAGNNFAVYVIHQIEMIVKKLGTGAQRIRAEHFGAQIYLHVDYADDRTATMIFARSLRFMAYMADGVKGGVRPVRVEVTSPYFDGLIADILHFFETGELSFDPSETLEVMRLREGAMLAGENDDTWIDLTKLG